MLCLAVFFSAKCLLPCQAILLFFKQASIILVGLFVFFSEGAYNYFWEGGDMKKRQAINFFSTTYIFFCFRVT